MFDQVIPSTAQLFQYLVLGIPYFKNRAYDLEYFDAKLKNAILAFGSETPDNLNCVQHIEFGCSFCQKTNQDRWGLKLKNTPIFIADLLQSLQKVKMPGNVKHYFPDLTNEEWLETVAFVYRVFLEMEAPTGLLFQMKDVFEDGLSNRLNQSLLDKINAHFHKVFISAPFIVFGFEREPYLRWGIRIEGYVFLSDIFNELESGEMPETIKNEFQLTNEQWEAVLRISTLVLLAFEGNEDFR